MRRKVTIKFDAVRWYKDRIANKEIDIAFVRSRMSEKPNSDTEAWTKLFAEQSRLHTLIAEYEAELSSAIATSARGK